MSLFENNFEVSCVSFLKGFERILSLFSLFFYLKNVTTSWGGAGMGLKEFWILYAFFLKNVKESCSHWCFIFLTILKNFKGPGSLVFEGIWKNLKGLLLFLFSRMWKNFLNLLYFVFPSLKESWGSLASLFWHKILKPVVFVFQRVWKNLDGNYW